MWKKNIPAKTFPDGSDRTVVLQLNNSITIINSYLPCRGKYTNDDYADEIDQIHEICTKFGNTHIMIAADMNIDLKRHQGPRVKSLQDLMKSHQLEEPSKIDSPTYIHHGGTAATKIDYIMISRSLRLDAFKHSYEILPESSLNTSPHQCLLLNTQGIQLQCVSETKLPARKKILWEKGSTQQYQELLSMYLEDTNDVVDVETSITYLISSIQKSAKLAFPVVTVKHHNKPKPWNDEIKELLQESKHIDTIWKEEGCPGPPNQTYSQRKEIRYSVRRAQRLEQAKKRELDQDKIMMANESDQTLFHQLIRKQRKQHTQQVNELVYDEVRHTGDLLPVWTNHFSSLAQPQDDDHFDQDFQLRCSQEVQHMVYLCTQFAINQIPITVHEVSQATAKLKKRKAKDDEDLVSEHLIHGGRPLAAFLCKIINQIIDQRKIPDRLKYGILHPIHKKDKAIDQPGNFRGITIVTIISKVLDIIHSSHQRAAIPEDKLDIQFGFTAGRSPSHATFLLNEAIADAKDSKKPLFVATLDLQKAFDVVPHDILLNKLFNHGLPGVWWLLKKEAYSGRTTRVVWCGSKGESYPNHQGIIQGGTGSGSDFKESTYDALLTATESNCGTKIGNTKLGTLACADDVVFIAPSEFELQQQIQMFNYFTNKDRFKIHPQKSYVSVFNPNQSEFEHYQSTQPWKINGAPASVSHEFTHLGIQYNLEKPSLTLAIP